MGDKDEVAVEVGSLDSGKHSAVVFLESKNTSNKNSAHSLKNTLASNQVGFFGSGKGIRKRGRIITKKI